MYCCKKFINKYIYQSCGVLPWKGVEARIKTLATLTFSGWSVVCFLAQGENGECDVQRNSCFQISIKKGLLREGSLYLMPFGISKMSAMSSSLLGLCVWAFPLHLPRNEYTSQTNECRRRNTECQWVFFLFLDVLNLSEYTLSEMEDVNQPYTCLNKEHNCQSKAIKSKNNH